MCDIWGYDQQEDGVQQQDAVRLHWVLFKFQGFKAVACHEQMQPWSLETGRPGKGVQQQNAVWLQWSAVSGNEPLTVAALHFVLFHVLCHHGLVCKGLRGGNFAAEDGSSCQVSQGGDWCGDSCDHRKLNPTYLDRCHVQQRGLWRAAEAVAEQRRLHHGEGIAHGFPLQPDAREGGLVRRVPKHLFNSWMWRWIGC